MVTRRVTSRVTAPTARRVTGDGVSAGSPWDNTYFVLATGQSNMLTRDDSDQSVTTLPKVKIWDSVGGALEQWDLTANPPQHLIADPGVGSSGAEVSHDNLGFYFCQQLSASTGKNVVVVMVAWGGTALEHWLSPSGAMYDEMVAQLASLYIPRIDLHIHHQGESNNNDAGFATDLTNFRSTIEGLTKVPASVPTICGEVLRTVSLEDVNTNLNTWASGDADIYIASSESLTDVGDGLHFNSASAEILASRMNALVDLDKIKSNLSGSRPSGSISDLSVSVASSTATLTWSDLADSSVVAYIIKRDGTEIARVAVGAETFGDTGLSAGTYEYKVEALNAFGVTPSNTDSGTVLPATLKTGLVSYWSLDEASGNAVDAHGSNDLTDNNAVGSAVGKVGNCRDFTAASDHSLSRASNSDLVTGDIDFTFACWVNLDDKTTTKDILGKWVSPEEYIIVYSLSSDRIAWLCENPSGTVTTSLANTFGAFTAGTWYFVVCYHDATNNEIGISVNGGPFDTAPHAGGVRSGSGVFSIGHRTASATGKMDGKMDEVGFWKRLLSADEIATLYNSGNGLAYSQF